MGLRRSIDGEAKRKMGVGTRRGRNARRLDNATVRWFASQQRLNCCAPALAYVR